MSALPIGHADLLELLAEPVLPAEGHRGTTYGWKPRPIRATDDRRHYERYHADDQQGAVVQHVVCRYVLGDVTRSELSREYGMCSRQVNAYVSGEAWVTYATPILEAIARLGVPPVKGFWTGDGARPRLLVRAQRSVIRRALLNSSDPAVQLDMRLLAIAWEDC